MNGLVQGVGFRPYVHHLAQKFKLNGKVSNTPKGVEILLSANAADAELFFDTLISNPPNHSRIILKSMEEIPLQVFGDFRIQTSHSEEQSDVYLTPDYTMCDSCRKELSDLNNRRYRYPFITCTQCGPRFSIGTAIPYDRNHTSMVLFFMCLECENEYGDSLDKRYHSQTNSCGSCGVQLKWKNKDGDWEKEKEKGDFLKKALEVLKLGQILAVKGVGGFLFLCDANKLETIQTLRSRKHRPSKPFALLYPNVERVEQDFDLSKDALKHLTGSVGPILLLKPNPGKDKSVCMEAIAPGLSKLGVMLPSAPLLDLISNDFGSPLIATSGNVSGSPIIHEEDDNLFEVCDFVLSHDRDIIMAQDDSVICLTEIHQQLISIRRSRGMAPSYFEYKPISDLTLLATGAMLKSSFTVSVLGKVFISQYLGNTGYFDVQDCYKKALQHFEQFFKPRIDQVICDKHPGYFSSELAYSYSESPILVQHHKSHAAAVLAENNLLMDQVLCVIWDGTGLGDDHQIWGGEFFKYEGHYLQRVNHLSYFPVIAGDKMALEPRLSLMSLDWKLGLNLGGISDKFSELEYKTYQKIIYKSPISCSSAGRVFDAAAAFLGLKDQQSYEGEAAMILEAKASEYVGKRGFNNLSSYYESNFEDGSISCVSIFKGMQVDKKKGLDTNEIAAKFHRSMVDLVATVAQSTGSKKLAFSGGVFQNSLLVDMLITYLGQHYQLYFHRELSPNDENISFGQMVYVDQDIDGCLSTGKIKSTNNSK